jgi:hypothetical protein
MRLPYKQIILPSVVGVLLPSMALAQRYLRDGINSAGTFVADPGGLIRTSPTEVIKNIILFMVGLVAVVALLGIVYGGFRIVTAFGNEKTIDSAKKIILWSVIGFVITVLSFVILRVAADIIGLGPNP